MILRQEDVTALPSSPESLVKDGGKELGIEEEESLNPFMRSSFIDVGVDCVTFPKTEQFYIVP